MIESIHLCKIFQARSICCSPSAAAGGDFSMPVQKTPASEEAGNGKRHNSRYSDWHTKNL